MAQTPTMLTNELTDALIAGLDPAISLGDALCPPKRDGRDKPGHDE